jgi:hypothetical protein
MEAKIDTIKQLITFVFIITIISTGIYIWMFNGARNSAAAVLPMTYTPGIYFR